MYVTQYYSSFFSLVLIEFGVVTPIKFRFHFRIRVNDVFYTVTDFVSYLFSYRFNALAVTCQPNQTEDML